MAIEKQDDAPLNLNQLSIKDECERIARQYLPKVSTALDFLFENDPYKGILAWERVTEFSVAKKNKETPLPPAANITINMVPARREDEAGYIDITNQKEIPNITDAEEIE